MARPRPGTPASRVLALGRVAGLAACTAGAPPEIATPTPQLPEGYFYAPGSDAVASLDALLPSKDAAYIALSQAAIERAVAISPQDSEIGLEAGVIAILGGREDAARTSWQSVIAVQPDSLAAETARGYLAQIGPGPETAPDPMPEPAIEGSQP